MTEKERNAVKNMLHSKQISEQIEFIICQGTFLII